MPITYLSEMFGAHKFIMIHLELKSVGSLLKPFFVAISRRDSAIGQKKQSWPLNLFPNLNQV